jgi:hypothetical protein
MAGELALKPIGERMARAAMFSTNSNNDVQRAFERC